MLSQATLGNVIAVQTNKTRLNLSYVKLLFIHCNNDECLSPNVDSFSREYLKDALSEDLTVLANTELIDGAGDARLMYRVVFINGNSVICIDTSIHPGLR